MTTHSHQITDQQECREALCSTVQERIEELMEVFYREAYYCDLALMESILVGFNKYCRDAGEAMLSALLDVMAKGRAS